MPSLGCKLEVQRVRSRLRWWNRRWYWRGALFDPNFGAEPVLVIDWQGPYPDAESARAEAEAAAETRVRSYAQEVYNIEDLPKRAREEQVNE